MIAQVRCSLCHAPGVARGADSASFAGEGDQAVVPTVVTAGAGKAVSKDATLQIFAKGFLHIRGRGAVVALAVELASAGQLKPGLEVLGHRAVQQGAFGVARVVVL